MAGSRSKAGFNGGPNTPNRARRSFIWKTGAAISGVFASTMAGIAKSGPKQDSGWKDEMARLSNQIGCLEDANAIRSLHRTYEDNLGKGLYEEVVGMFSDNAEVVFNGGLFAGKDKGVRRLYCDHFRQGLTGKRIEPAPGIDPNPAQVQDFVEVAPDRNSAKAGFAFSMQVGTPFAADLPFLEMARLQGQGIRQWWEAGIYEASYVKESDTWKISRLEHRVTSRADYRPGRSYAKPITVQAFLNTYPENPTGPDKIK
jgi:hypothetical protein